jgi:hypothetical protein
MDPIKKEIKEEHKEFLPTQFLASVKCEEEEGQHSRYQLFTSMPDPDPNPPPSSM